MKREGGKGVATEAGAQLIIKCWTWTWRLGRDALRAAPWGLLIFALPKAEKEITKLRVMGREREIARGAEEGVPTVWWPHVRAKRFKSKLTALQTALRLVRSLSLFSVLCFVPFLTPSHGEPFSGLWAELLGRMLAHGNCLFKRARPAACVLHP